ncbi:MAG: hydantoinase B/oxoprolinase family protein, partial [Myxococcota bacterium]|nr:hydantoinase B/oxoprolinase family protein [Myxococcota bacterium]
GDGCVREIEALSDCQAALLATRRESGAAGLDGGGAGAPGADHVFRNGAWKAWDGMAVDLVAGDRVRVETPGGGGWGRE